MVLVAYRHGLRVSAGRPSLGPDELETATLHARRVKKGTPSTHPILAGTSCGRPPVVSLRRVPSCRQRSSAPLSERKRRFSIPYSSSASRVTAGAAGLLTFSQQLARPER